MDGPCATLAIRPVHVEGDRVASLHRYERNRRRWTRRFPNVKSFQTPARNVPPTNEPCLAVINSFWGRNEPPNMHSSRKAIEFARYFLREEVATVGIRGAFLLLRGTYENTASIWAQMAQTPNSSLQTQWGKRLAESRRTRVLVVVLADCPRFHQELSGQRNVRKCPRTRRTA